MPKSQVSKLCKDIDEPVNAFLDRPLDGEWPYLWLDATYLKVRDGGRIVSVMAIIATALSSDGRREIVGLGIGPSRRSPWSPHYTLAFSTLQHYRCNDDSCPRPVARLSVDRSAPWDARGEFGRCGGCLRNQCLAT